MTATLTPTLIARIGRDVGLAADETLLGFAPDGTPIVCHASGKLGLKVGVIYVGDEIPYDDTEAFDPLGQGAN